MTKKEMEKRRKERGTNHAKQQKPSVAKNTKNPKKASRGTKKTSAKTSSAPSLAAQYQAITEPEYALFTRRVLPNSEVAWIVLHRPTQKAGCFKTSELLQYRDMLSGMSLDDVLTIGIAAGTEQVLREKQMQAQVVLVD